MRLRNGSDGARGLRQARRGFIIFGTRTRLVSDGTGSIQAPCPSCQQMSRLDGMKAQQWFTLYFIPVFPMGGGTRFTQCAICKAQFRANLDQMRQMLANGARQGPPAMPGQCAGPLGASAAASGAGFQQAIALYNSLRETPEDSAKLGQLLQMYLTMNEPGEAVSAGKEYPRAVEVSDLCCSLMSQAYLRLGDREAAARYATAALALNPNNGKALALQGQAMTAG